MCAMVASSVPPAAASADGAQAALDAVEELTAALDSGQSVDGLHDDLDGVVSLVGDIATAAVVGVPSAAATLMSADLSLVAALRDSAGHCEDAVLLALEQMRAGLLDLIECQPVRRDLPASDLLAWLDDILDSDRAELASILGTSRRSLQRWLSQPHVVPAGVIPRLRLVARVVNELRFAYEGGPAIARWFLTPKRGLAGGRPVDVLDDADAVDLLMPIALGARFG
jgi:hypothetical protein